MRACLPLLFLVACGAGEGAAATSADVSAGPVCDPRTYGAKGDGTTLDTAAIQAAVDACAGKHGEVLLRNGTFRSGTITLGSALTFHVDAGAQLVGSRSDDDYPTQSPPTDNSQLLNTRKALLYAVGAKELRITGPGTIDGSGDNPAWTDPNGPDAKEAKRPMVVFVVQGDGVTIDNVTIRRSAMWSVVNMETDNLTIAKVTVDSRAGGMRDGLDIVDCHHVRIDDVDISSEDDSICIKSGVARGVDDVVVTNSRVHTSGVANSLKVGTASYGPVTNLTFDGITITGAQKAAMALEAVDGSSIANVAFKNVTFANVGTPLFLLVGDRGARPATAPRQIGGIDAVTFEHVSGSAYETWGSIVSGLAEDGRVHPVTNVRFDDVHVTVPGKAGSVPATPPEYDRTFSNGHYPDPNLWGNVPAAGIWFRHARNVTFANSSVTTVAGDARPLFAGMDVASVTGPSSAVHFVVHAAPPGIVAIAGATTGAVGLDADPLGGWAGPGLVLTASAADPTTLIGDVTLPQGAALAYKATTSREGAVTYERSGAGNRTTTVPSSPTATIELTWEN